MSRPFCRQQLFKILEHLPSMVLIINTVNVSNIPIAHYGYLDMVSDGRTDGGRQPNYIPPISSGDKNISASDDCMEDCVWKHVYAIIKMFMDLQCKINIKLAVKMGNHTHFYLPYLYQEMDVCTLMSF